MSLAAWDNTQAHLGRLLDCLLVFNFLCDKFSLPLMSLVQCARCTVFRSYVFCWHCNWNAREKCGNRLFCPLWQVCCDTHQIRRVFIWKNLPPQRVFCSGLQVLWEVEFPGLSCLNVSKMAASVWVKAQPAALLGVCGGQKTKAKTSQCKETRSQVISSVAGQTWFVPRDRDKPMTLKRTNLRNTINTPQDSTSSGVVFGFPKRSCFLFWMYSPSQLRFSHHITTI